MKPGMKGLLLLLTLFLAPGWAIARDADQRAMVHKPITLYGGSKGDPYTLYLPLELTRPGEISVYLRVDDLDPDPKNQNFEPLRVVVVDGRAFKKMAPSQWKKFCVEANKYNPVEWLAGDEIRGFVKGVKHLFGKKEKPPAYFHGQIACGREGTGESIWHAVDAPELAKTEGRYVVILRNIAPFKASARILIRYPGESWDFDPAVTRSTQVHPDLAVEEAALNAGKQLEVTLANRGQGVLHEGFWHLKGERAVTLIAKVDGRSYGATLPAFDPERRLLKPGGTLVYTFDKLRLAKAGEVSVTVDASNQVFEERKDNNVLTRSLGAPQFVPLGTRPVATMAKPRPDLAVTAIQLNPGKVIEVMVRNVGNAGLDPALWSGANPPLLNLKMNGKGWANVTLSFLDPARSLARPGGTVVYSTDYKLTKKAVITATIDDTGLIEETDEGNNSLKVTLKP
ncbi:MAG: hypothetical protein JXB25_02835 [Deltaproteobacteria bacterium]|nr:hypothetical protein [Deltaproteobacteria bacterium]